MASFYDAVNNADLDGVESILKSGGIEYSLRVLGDDASIREIDVAEEDQLYADWLLSSPEQQRN
jgi:hypothetical protein